MLRSYIENLHKHVEQVNNEKQRAKQQEVAALQTMPPPVKSLEQQLTCYFRTLSQEQLKRPRTMIEIIQAADLKGKFREHPHPQKISEILGRLNWRRHRAYGANAGRYWLPPSIG